MIAPNENILYDVLIDNTAFFKDFENIDVAKYLFEKSKKEVIYLLKTDNEVIYTENGQVPYNSNYTYNSGEIMYYYDQRHTIGVDFVQPTLLKGIITIDESSKYTDVAQAIFRMRKINEGHTIDICYVGKDKQKYNTSNQILKLILQNEIQFNQSIKPLLYLQYLKYFIRKYTKNYKETDLAPLYEIINKNPTIEIKNIITQKIIRNILDNKLPEEINNIVLNINDKNIINKLLSIFNNLTEREKINVLFNSNMINIEKENVVELQIIVEHQKQKEKQKEDSKLFFNLPKNSYFIIYNYFLEIQEFKKQNLIFIDLIANDIRIILPVSSFTLLYSYGHKQGDFVFIEIQSNVYMFDHVLNINYYLYKFPIYNKSGKLINSSVFKTKSKIFDIENIFNLSFSCKGIKPQSKYNKISISFKHLFNIDNDIIKEINNIPENEFEKLIYVYLIFAYFFQLPINKYFDIISVETTNRITKEIDDINYLSPNYIKYASDFYYKIGLNRLLDNNEIIKINTKKYNIVYEYLSSVNVDNNLTVNYNLYNISQGGFTKYQEEYYKSKYLKYKQKYLDIKI